MENLSQWRGFQALSAQLRSPFLSPEFVLAMARHCSGVEVAVIEQHGRIVGYFPYKRRPLGIGKALGYGLTDVQGVVHAADFEWCGRELLEACKLVIWEFDSLVAEQVPKFKPQEFSTRAALSVNLSVGWCERATARAGRRRFRQFRQRERKLCREAASPEYVFRSSSTADLDLLIRWKSHQYRRTGRKDRFAKKWLVYVLRELFEIHEPGFGMNLSVMRVNGRPVSLDLSLVANQTIAGWFPAYDRSFRQYGVGLLHLEALLKMAAAEGFHCYALGAGDEDYKNAFGEVRADVASGSLRLGTAVAASRWLQTAPKRAALRLVLSQPYLRSAARHALNHVGRLRTRFSG